MDHPSAQRCGLIWNYIDHL